MLLAEKEVKAELFWLHELPFNQTLQMFKGVKNLHWYKLLRSNLSKNYAPI